MFRVMAQLKHLSLSPTATHTHQTVRWKRKPIWMPTAKSKVFRIPVRPKVPPEEHNEILRLFNNYRTGMKTVRQYLTSKYSVQLQAKSDTEASQREFEEDLARCNALNNEWNEEVRREREARYAKELDEELQLAEEKRNQRLAEKLALEAEAERIVKEHKDIVEMFITPETLDAAIEKALANPVDYNFAIDLDGNFIKGREAVPLDKIKVKH